MVGASMALGLEGAGLSALAASVGETAPQIPEAEIERAPVVFVAIIGSFQLHAERDRPDYGAPVDITSIVSEAVDHMEAAIESGGWRLKAQTQSGLVVPGDAGMLARLIANLLENVAK